VTLSAEALEGVDVEEQLHEVVVDGVGQALDHVDVLAADVLEHADKGVALGKVLRVAGGRADVQLAADGACQGYAG
jgi:hypothetical protein